MFEVLAFVVGFLIGFIGTTAYHRSQIRQHYIYIGDESVTSLQDKIASEKKINADEQLLYAKMLQASNKEIKRKDF